MTARDADTPEGIRGRNARSGEARSASARAADEPVSPPGPDESWTVLRMIRWSGQYLEEKGIEEGRRDAEHLLAEALGMPRLELYLQFDRPLTPDELSAYKPLLLRRAEREPLQYVLGWTGFRELELKCDRRALIPRPETEVLVQAVLDWVAGRPEPDGGWTALDVGTGTGAVALSLLREGPFGRVVATDRSAEALSLARENAEAHELADALELREGSLFEPLTDDEAFDVVVANPPYVGEAEAGSLAPEVREWEPAEALFAGADGLAVLRPLIRGAPARLRSGGLLALEIGEGQGDAVRTVAEEVEALDEPELRRDLAGRRRILLVPRR